VTSAETRPGGSPWSAASTAKPMTRTDPVRSMRRFSGTSRPCATPAACAVALVAATSAPEPDPLPELEPVQVPEDAAPRTEQPTEAGLPIFDDNGEVAWIAKRADPPPPPPPFEALPERPLFAPEPVDGSPVRRPRAPVGPGAGGDYWPWDAATSTGTGTGLRVTTGSGVIEAVEDFEDDERPGRSWLWLAGIVALLAAALLVIVFVFNLGRGLPTIGGGDDEPDQPRGSRTPSTGTSADAGPVAYTGVVADDFDPQGDPPEEMPDLVALAVDGDPSTAWRTMTYSQQLGPGGLKTGVGLTLDLGASGEVDEVDMTLVGAPTGVTVYVADTAPRGIRGLTPVATATADATDLPITLDQPATGRYVTVWLTSLPPVDGGFRGEIAEVSVLGPAASP
jgi:hypothetical protein